MTNFFNRKFTIFTSLAVIILIGVILRFYQLGTNPPSLDWDEASLGYNAYSILKTGADEYGNKFPLSIRSFDDYKPALYAYLDVIPISLFGLNEFSVRLPAAFFGILAIIVIFYLTKEIFSEWEKKKQTIVSLLTAFFLAISPWHLQFSRAAFEGNIGFFFFISGLLFFLKAFKNKIFFYLSSAFFLLSLYSYHSFRLLIPLFIVVLLIVFFKKIIFSKTEAIVFILILLLGSFPIWGSFLGHGAGPSARLSMVTIFTDPTVINPSIERLNYDRSYNDFIGELFHNRRVVYALAIVKGYLDHFNPDFLFIRGDGGVQHHAVNMGMLFLWDLPFILAGVYFLLRRCSRLIFVLFASFLLSPLPAALTTGTPHPVRAIGMLLGFSVFASVGVIFFWEKIMLLKNILIRSGLIFIIIILFIVNITYYLHQYYAHTPVEYGYFWQYGYKEALGYAKDNEGKYDSIIMTYEYDQPYIYYLFYNKIDPIWYQKNWDYNKNGTVNRFERVIGKYVFKNIEYEKDIRAPNALLIGTPQEIPASVKAIKTIEFLDGRTAFKITKT